MSTDLRAGELAIYVHYAGLDEWNFDAQSESFAWLAAQRGIELTVVKDPDAQHSARYFREALPCAFLWLGQHLLPAVCAPGAGALAIPAQWGVLSNGTVASPQAAPSTVATKP